jgi:L-arabinonolactonase
MPLVDVLRVENTLGEGVLWNHRTGMLWWTDIQSCRLYRYDWQQRHLQQYETPRRVGSFGFVAGSCRLITAFDSGIALYDPDTQQVDWLARPEAAVPQLRFNDGRVDRQGRFWAGSMVETPSSTVSANLYCIDHHGQALLRRQGIRISNGLCFSPDGRYLYFADSPSHCIERFALQEPQGTLGAAQPFARAPTGIHPDGANVDAQGYLWSAHWGAGQVVRYSPAGDIDRILPVPATQPTCVAFGGPDLNLLFVSSAREGLSAEALRQQPDAGAVFVFDVGIRGLPEPHYRYDPGAAASRSDLQPIEVPGRQS